MPTGNVDRCLQRFYSCIHMRTQLTVNHELMMYAAELDMLAP
jgi:hypothetical protein